MIGPLHITMKTSLFKTGSALTNGLGFSAFIKYVSKYKRRTKSLMWAKGCWQLPLLMAPVTLSRLLLLNKVASMRVMPPFGKSLAIWNSLTRKRYPRIIFQIQSSSLQRAAFSYVGSPKMSKNCAFLLGIIALGFHTKSAQKWNHTISYPNANAEHRFEKNSHTSDLLLGLDTFEDSLIRNV